MLKILKFLIPFSFCLPSLFSFAQSGEFELYNTTYDLLTQNLYLHHSKAISEASRILNGPEYYYDDIITGGNPFLGTTQFHDGSVIYEGIRYDNQEIGYDIYRDEIFISRYDQHGILSKINLSDNKVNGFYLSEHQFIRLNKDDQENHPGTGYYEILYTGGVAVFVKRTKKIVPANDGGLYQFKFQSSDKIYVYKDQIFNRIILKKALTTILQDEKRNLRAYYKNNRQAMKSLESYVVRLCSYYDRLKSNARK